MATFALHAATASAESPQADRLFDEGRELFKEGKYDEACEKFAEAYALDKGPGIVANHADCLERFNELPKAWRLFQDAAERWDRSGNASGAKVARDRATKIVARLATVVMGVPDPELAGLAITINGRTVKPAAEIRDVFVPGPVKIVAEAPGREPFTRTQLVGAGETIVVELKFPTPEANGPVVKQGEDNRVRRRSRVRLAIGLGVTSGAALATAAVFGIYGDQRYDQTAKDNTYCTPGTRPPRCDDIGIARLRDAQRFADIGTYVGIGGGIVAIISAAVYFTAPKDLVAAPMVSGSSAGFTLSGRF